MAKLTDQPFVPSTVEQLRAWLRDTTEGRAIMDTLAEEAFERRCRTCERIGPVPKVLVVVRRLGPRPGAEVFWEPGVLVRLEELVDTCDSPAMERVADEILYYQLPKTWKHLTACRSASIPFTALTAERKLYSLRALEWLREWDEWEKRPRP